MKGISVLRQGVRARHNDPRAPTGLLATKLLVFAPKASMLWAGNIYGTLDAITITVLSLGEGFRRNATFRKAGRLRAGLRLGPTIVACPRVHDTIPRPALRVPGPFLPGTWWGERSVVNQPYALHQA